MVYFIKRVDRVSGCVLSSSNDEIGGKTKFALDTVDNF